MPTPYEEELEDLLFYMLRRNDAAEINENPHDRCWLEKKYGQVWSEAEATSAFELRGVMSPYVAALRKLDGVRGTLTFQDEPRFYFKFEPI